MNIRAFLFVSILSVFATSALAMERTFALIKPDAVRAKNSGKIIDIIEQNGFNIRSLKKGYLGKVSAKELYAAHKGKSFFKKHIEFMASGPVIVLLLEKENAIADWRKLMGTTNHKEAEVGTIRKQFASSITENAVHGSDSPESAQREIDLFFGERELE